VGFGKSAAWGERLGSLRKGNKTPSRTRNRGGPSERCEMRPGFGIFKGVEVGNMAGCQVCNEERLSAQEASQHGKETKNRHGTRGHHSKSGEGEKKISIKGGHTNFGGSSTKFDNPREGTKAATSGEKVVVTCTIVITLQMERQKSYCDERFLGSEVRGGNSRKFASRLYPSSKVKNGDVRSYSIPIFPSGKNSLKCVRGRLKNQ